MDDSRSTSNILTGLTGKRLLLKAGLRWEDNVRMYLVGLGVTCSLRDPRFMGSNPSEVDGFFQDVKILSTIPPGGTLSCESRV